MKPKIKNKYLRDILKEMCRKVGANFNEIDFKKERWYEEYSWTVEQQNDFISWLAEYLKKNQGARIGPERIPELEIYAHNSRFLLEFAKSFAFNYGWVLTNKKKVI